MYAEHRRQFFAEMEDGLALVPASHGQLRNQDTDHIFRQNSDFMHLCGFEEPDAIAAFVKQGKKTRYVLFVNPRDPALEIWTGRRAGTKGARKDHGADEAWELAEFGTRLPDLLSGSPCVYMPLGPDSFGPAWPRQNDVMRAINALSYKRKTPLVVPDTLRDVRALLARIRLRKSAAELELLEGACAVTAEAFAEAMSCAKPGVREYQVKAVMQLVYGMRGGDWAFDTIVAGGANACVLHYVGCRDTLRDGELVVVDAGAELNGYCADVTRTFPVNGHFSPVQKRVYNAVLAAQHAAILAAGPGVPVDQVHEAAVTSLIHSMLKLGALKGSEASVRRSGNWKRYYPHGTGHWLGRDVHDVGDYANRESVTRLEPGMVMTVEPGLYFPPDDKRLPTELRGIGVRIEDDILITETGTRVLTSAIPKSVAAVEKACAVRSSWLKKPVI